MVEYPKTIILKGREVAVRDERPAGGTIRPGSLVVMNSSGNFIVHGTAKQKAQPTFAVEYENLLPNKSSAGGIDDNYSSGDLVQAETVKPGAWVYALVAASATAITKGALLESAGDGTLKLITDFTDAEIDSIGGGAIARALEAVDNSGGGTQARIRVEII
jgi:hypothetical protein